MAGTMASAQICHVFVYQFQPVEGKPPYWSCDIRAVDKIPTFGRYHKQFVSDLCFVWRYPADVSIEEAAKNLKLKSLLYMTLSDFCVFHCHGVSGVIVHKALETVRSSKHLIVAYDSPLHGLSESWKENFENLATKPDFTPLDGAISVLSGIAILASKSSRKKKLWETFLATCSGITSFLEPEAVIELAQSFLSFYREQIQSFLTFTPCKFRRDAVVTVGFEFSKSYQDWIFEPFNPHIKINRKISTSAEHALANMDMFRDEKTNAEMADWIKTLISELKLNERFSLPVLLPTQSQIGGW